MNLSRREFSAVAGSTTAAATLFGLGAWGGAPTRRSAADETWFDWKSVADNAWVALGEGGNVLALFDKGEWILVDTKNPGYADTLRREASSRTPQKMTLTRVINTHHHMDHSGGNYAFLPAIPVLAHAKAKPRIAAQVERYRDRLKGVPAQVAKSEKPAAKELLNEVTQLVDRLESLTPERYIPTELMESEHEIKVGSRKVILRHFGPGHTDNDIIVFVPDLNLMHTGDLFFNKRHPVMDVPGGATSTGWGESLAKMFEFCNDKTVVIPGHGDISNLTGLRAQATYFKTMRATVEKAIDDAKSRDETTKLIVEEYKEYASPQSRTAVLGAIYDELKAPKPK